jgi:hypothetical protein
MARRYGLDERSFQRSLESLERFVLGCLCLPCLTGQHNNSSHQSELWGAMSSAARHSAGLNIVSLSPRMPETRTPTSSRYGDTLSHQLDDWMQVFVRCETGVVISPTCQRKRSTAEGAFAFCCKAKMTAGDTMRRCRHGSGLVS